jgi:hypothetical protein
MDRAFDAAAVEAIAMTKLVLLLVAATAWAGDRRADVRFCNMTPDNASSDVSKACARTLEKRLAADYTEMSRIGETALRREITETASPFMAWSAAKLKLGRAKSDALVLVDCRPEFGRLDLIVEGTTTTHISLRDTVLDNTTLDVVGEQVLRRVWQGFSP